MFNYSGHHCCPKDDSSSFYFKLEDHIKEPVGKQQQQGLSTHLLVRVPRLGDSEGTFSVIESSCHLLLPV